MPKSNMDNILKKANSKEQVRYCRKFINSLGFCSFSRYTLQRRGKECIYTGNEALCEMYHESVLTGRC